MQSHRKHHPWQNHKLSQCTAPSGALYHWLPWTELRSGSTQAASHA